jgi:predicted acylesterase/phospholipase RssA
MGNALVLSAGGLWTAWEPGAWSVLRDRFRPDLIVGTSAGAWNGWALAGGATAEELAQQWLDPRLATVLEFGLHRTGFLNPKPFLEFSRDLFERYRPRIPFALTVVELPFLQTHIVRDRDITWKHLAASAAILGGVPPVAIDGRRYVDGGLRGGLPLWAAEALGARRALALNVLTGTTFQVLRAITRGKTATSGLHVKIVEPSRRLGSIRDALVWNPSNVERWVEQGRSDASSITM